MNKVQVSNEDIYFVIPFVYHKGLLRCGDKEVTSDWEKIYRLRYVEVDKVQKKSDLIRLVEKEILGICYADVLTIGLYEKI